MQVEMQMKRLLVLGAGGQIARWVIEMLAKRDDVKLTLFLRHAKKLKNAPKNSKVLQGDVLHKEQLHPAIAGQDIVYANLTGSDIDRQGEGHRRGDGCGRVEASALCGVARYL